MARRLDPVSWSLRLRIFLFFALIGLGAAAAVIGGGLIAWARMDDVGVVPALTLGGAVAIAATLGLSLWVWLRFDENVAKPIDALALELRSRAHAPVDTEIDAEAAAGWASSPPPPPS